MAFAASAMRAQTTVADPRLAPMVAKLDSLVAADPQLVISAAVVEGGKVTWEAGFGSFNGHRADATAVAPIASVSKSITAVGALLLAQEGRLDLDAPIDRYLGPARARNAAKGVTTRQLLSMTAGYPHLVRFYWYGGPAALGIDSVLGRYAVPAFPPGERFHYSNLSFEVVAAVIEKASGLSFADYMRTHVFDQAGMGDTRLRPRIGDENAPPGYAGQTALPVGGLEPNGGAGFRSSAHDLASLAAALLGGRILNGESRAALWDFSTRGFYALGWWRDLGRGTEQIAIADGAMAGGSATLAVDPRRGLAAAVVLNRGNGATPPLAGGLLRALDPSAPPSARPNLPAALRTEAFVGAAALDGTWCGTVDSDRQSALARLVVHGTEFTLALDGAPGATGSAPAITDGVLQVQFPATLPFPDVATTPHSVTLFVRQAGDSLAGYAMAASSGARPLFNLPFPVRLSRTTRCRRGDQ